VTELQELRERLVTGLRAADALHDDRVAAALTEVPRHLFLPGIEPGQAYADDAVITKLDADGRAVSSSSQPAIMALMLEQLDVQPGHRVLEVGAGTGYNAALLARLAGTEGSVTTVDLDADIVAAAREHLAACGFGQVNVVHADGGGGWPPGAPYDRIILTVGTWDITPAWFRQLAPGGRLLLPLALRAGMQYSIAFEQADDHLESTSVVPCGFMRLRGAFAGPETVIPLGDHTGMLADDAPQPAGADDLPDLLARPGRPLGSGVQVTAGDLYGGLGLWLAMREPGIGQLYAFGAAARTGPAAAFTRGPAMGLLTSAHGCATLLPLDHENRTQRTGPAASFELGACPFGTEGTELAGRLVRHVRDWHAAGRPSLAGLRVSAYPRGASRPAAGHAAVISKQYAQLMITWPAAGLRPG
jgi:protein-L-isoaspartate(D-aspartate) O-methyltransferase